MLRANLDTDNGHTNGALGYVDKITTNKKGEISEIFVKFRDDAVGQKERAEGTATPSGAISVPLHSVTFTGKNNVQVTRYQFPIVTCFACTVHKVCPLAAMAATATSA